LIFRCEAEVHLRLPMFGRARSNCRYKTARHTSQQARSRRSSRPTCHKSKFSDRVIDACPGQPGLFFLTTPQITRDTFSVLCRISTKGVSKNRGPFSPVFLLITSRSLSSLPYPSLLSFPSLPFRREAVPLNLIRG